LAAAAQLAPALISIWLFVVGSIIGSFLNVVAYRLPRGLSLSHPSSRCPHCEHPIRWYDNVPVIGWLLLGGRCRDCQSPISARYPIVEALSGALFLLAAWIDLFGETSNLAAPGAGLDESGIQPWFVYAYHLVLLTTLLAAALIEWDANRPPLRLLWVAALIGVFAPLVHAGMRPLPAGLPPMPLELQALSEGLLGASAGVLFGCLAWPALARGGRDPAGAIVHLPKFALVGLFLGWQAVALVAVVTSAIYFFASFWPRRLASFDALWTLALLLATLLYLAFSSKLVDGLAQSSAVTDPLLAIYAGLAVAGFSLAAWAFDHVLARRS
jgi:leader peptidase (prepilin peptidase)/N-methyltransferase